MTKTRTSPYHPQSDGLVERFNRTLADMLSHYVNDHHNDWDERLPMVMMAYRSSEHETTGVTPYYAMFGREFRLPIDVSYGLPEPDRNLTEYITERRETIEDAYRKVREKRDLKHQLQKSYYDRACNRKEILTEGDQVWVWYPHTRRGRSAKFHRPWDGPYLIRKKLSDVTFRVQKMGSRNKRLVLHINRLKLYKARNPT